MSQITMKGGISILLLCFLNLGSFAQEYYLPKLKTEGSFVKDFGPKGWSVSDSIKGDLNKDAALDAVFILTKKDSITVKDSEGDDYKILPRVLVIAFGMTDKTFRLVEFNKKMLIEEEDSPPKYGSSFGSMSIENNILKIEFSFDYIQGNFYFYTYKFRYQNNAFKLIGEDNEYVTRRTMDFEKTSYNYLTRKSSLTIGTHSDDDPPKLIEKTNWFDLENKPLRAFKAMEQPGFRTVKTSK